MKQIPDIVLNEMLAITKVFYNREKPGTVKYANAVRRAIKLHKKLLKLKDESEYEQQGRSWANDAR